MEGIPDLDGSALAGSVSTQEGEGEKVECEKS
jgi:hypothetical protein